MMGNPADDKINRLPLDDDLLTERQLRPILPVALKTLQQWRALRKGPRFVRLGRRVFYLRSDVARFVAENLVETAPSEHAR
jgi:hypothetical protein